jgi:cob(I)alamin adenosyltransferase
VSERKIHRGDGGETQLASGQWVRKDDLRIECVGSVDELSSFLGLARAGLETHAEAAGAADIGASLRRIQQNLYVLGAELARRDDAADAGVGPRITAEQVAILDREIADIDARLPKLRAFILPGGGQVASHLHVARAVCRRAERQVVRLAAVEGLGAQVVPYLNRLSLLLFVMARQAAHLLQSDPQSGNEVVRDGAVVGDEGRAFDDDLCDQ